MLFRSAVPHDALDATAVVPGTIKEPDFTGGGEMLYIPLEIPLRGLTLRRSGKSHDARNTWVEVFGDSLDRATLTRSIAALKQYDNPSTG